MVVTSIVTVPTVSEKPGKNEFFKVREKSGKFEIGEKCLGI